MRKAVLITAVVAVAGAAMWMLRGAVGNTPAAPTASTPTAAAAPITRKVFLAYSDAKAALEAHRDQVPDALRGKPPLEQEAAWPPG